LEETDDMSMRLARGTSVRALVSYVRTALEEREPLGQDGEDVASWGAV